MKCDKSIIDIMEEMVDQNRIDFNDLCSLIYNKKHHIISKLSSYKDVEFNIYVDYETYAYLKASCPQHESAGYEFMHKDEILGCKIFKVIGSGFHLNISEIK